MANIQTWTSLRYFKPGNTTDNWGDANAISDETLLRLDDFRHDLGCAIHVVRGVAKSGHTSKSEHYAEYDEAGEITKVPTAVDIIVPDFQLSPFDLVLAAEKFGFRGIGYYPHWKWQGAVVGGLHLDCRTYREQDDGTLDYRHARWMGIPGPDNTQVYIALSFENLLKYSNYGADINIDGLH